MATNLIRMNMIELAFGSKESKFGGFLRLVNIPSEVAGLDRILPFLTWECRQLLTGIRTLTRQHLHQRATVSSVLTVLFEANSVELETEPGCLSPDTAMRGDIGTFPVESTIVHRSGLSGR